MTVTTRKRYALPVLAGFLILLASVFIVQARAETREFQNTAALQIPAGKQASLYPASIDVSGMSGPDIEVTVTLHELSHENLKDLAVLLVGPGGGRGVVLMASYDRTGSGSYSVSNANPTFKDLSEPVVGCSLPEGLLPNFPGGEHDYSPFNCGLAAPFPAPAPEEPYGYMLEAEETNGAWSLYVDNDTGDQGGSIAGGWSLHITTLGPVAPINTVPPSISGAGQVGQTLVCSEGSWMRGYAPVSFSYQWLRDGSNIPGASAATYVVQDDDQGHTLSCQVTASNSAGHETAISAGVAIPIGASRSGSSAESTSGGSPNGGSSASAGIGTASVSSAQIAALLSAQLSQSSKAAKIATLLKHDGFTVTFRAPEAGTAVIDWYEVPRHIKRDKGTKTKPVLVATGARAFATAETATLGVKLTTMGKAVLKHARRLKLTAHGIFTPRGGAPSAATETFELNR